MFEPLGMDLYEALKRRGYRGFPLAAARRAAYCIVRCLALLRRHGIIHCDLKPENVLLTLPPQHQRRSGSTGNNINVKVSDTSVIMTVVTLLKVNVEISTFRGRSQGLPRGRNISSSIKGRIVLLL